MHVCIRMYSCMHVSSWTIYSALHHIIIGCAHVTLLSPHLLKPPPHNNLLQRPASLLSYVELVPAMRACWLMIVMRKDLVDKSFELELSWWPCLLRLLQRNSAAKQFHPSVHEWNSALCSNKRREIESESESSPSQFVANPQIDHILQSEW